MRSGPVLVVGDVIDDLIVRPLGPIRVDTDTPSTIERRAGGSAANAACWLASAGGSATLVATVGADDVERHAALLGRHGVRAALTGSATTTTGTIVVLSDGTVRTMLTDRGANAGTTPSQATPELLTAHAHLHLTGHVLTGTDRDVGWRALLDDAAASGLTRSVSPGSVALLQTYGVDRFLALVAGVELLLPSLDEALLLTGEADASAAARALARRHELVVVTCGAAGAVVATGGRTDAVPAVRAVASVDVTGAGDAFAGGLLAALGEGLAPLAAAHRAAAVASRAVGIVGARPA